MHGRTSVVIIVTGAVVVVADSRKISFSPPSYCNDSFDFREGHVTVITILVFSVIRGKKKTKLWKENSRFRFFLFVFFRKRSIIGDHDFLTFVKIDNFAKFYRIYFEERLNYGFLTKNILFLKRIHQNERMCNFCHKVLQLILIYCLVEKKNAFIKFGEKN